MRKFGNLIFKKPNIMVGYRVIENDMKNRNLFK